MNLSMKTAWQSAVLILLGLSLIACGVGNEQGFNEAVELNSKNILEIEVRSDNERVSEGETERYLAYGIDDEGNEIDLTSSVNWSSSDTSIVTINSEGVATGLSNGTVDIIARMADLSGSKSLRSSDAALASIEISQQPSSISVCQTSSQQLKATGFYADLDEADISDKVSWSSSDANIVYVGDDEDLSDDAREAKGMLSALSSGSASITASHEGVDSAAVLITVEDNLLGVTISSADTDFYAEETSQFTAMGEYDSDSVDITENVTWVSSDTGVLSFSETTIGLASLDTAGSTNVSAICGQGGDNVVESGLLPITVNDPVTVETLRIKIGSDSYDDGVTIELDLEDASAQLELYFVYSNDEEGSEDLADEDETTWPTSESILVSGEAPTISSSGLVSFDAIGEAKYTVLYKDDDSGTNKDIDFFIKVE